MIQDYVGSMVDASGEILHGAFAKLVDSEDKVIDVRDPIYVVLKYINAEGMEQVCKKDIRGMLASKMLFTRQI